MNRVQLTAGLVLVVVAALALLFGVEGLLRGIAIAAAVLGVGLAATAARR